ncbi:MAG: 23S rRNA (uracil(1939)-C(5))-methyltransferase RlmD [Thermodesulfobacteriota bacterium]
MSSHRLHSEDSSPLAVGREVELAVEKLALGGAGLARFEGLAVFVERGLPGQRVLARVTLAKKRHAEAEVLRVLSPSPHQTEPFCPHFGACGGCSHQDLGYDQQLHWKHLQVQETLARLGNLGEAAAAKVLPILPSPETRHFRNKMEFAFAGGAGERLSLGLRPRGSAEGLIDIETCQLQSPQSARIVNAARDFCRTTGFPAYDPARDSGLWRHLVVREGKGTGQCLVHCITAPWRQAAEAVEALADHLHAAFPTLTSFVHSTRRNRLAVAQGEVQRFATGPGHIFENLGPFTFRISPDAFFQTNTQAAHLLYTAALELGRLDPGWTVWDLYCGSGGLTLYAAKACHKAVGFEADPRSVEDALANAADNGVPNCEFHAVDVLHALSQAPYAPDAVILDPPRSGLHPDGVRELLRLAPRRIVYVSCNPATLARDLAALKERYALAAARPVDLFPHSPHIECAACLDRLK